MKWITGMGTDEYAFIRDHPRPSVFSVVHGIAKTTPSITTTALRLRDSATLR